MECKLAEVVSGEDDGGESAGCRRTAANIDSDVEYFTFNNAAEFCLRASQLVMGSAKGSASGVRMIVLHELAIYTEGREFLAMISLKEKAAVVGDYVRFDHENFRKRGSNGAQLDSPSSETAPMRVK